MASQNLDVVVDEDRHRRHRLRAGVAMSLPPRVSNLTATYPGSLATEFLEVRGTGKAHLSVSGGRVEQLNSNKTY